MVKNGFKGTLCVRPQELAWQIRAIFERVADHEPEASFDDSESNIASLADLLWADIDARLDAEGFEVIVAPTQRVGVGAVIQWTSDDAARDAFHAAREVVVDQWVDDFLTEVRRDM